MSSEKSFSCEIVTPDSIVFEGDVSSLILPGAEGRFGILFNHTPYMAVLNVGKIEFEDTDGRSTLACGGGYAEISDNHVRVLADTAEFPGDIDVERAREKLESSKESLQDTQDPNDRERLKNTVERAQLRLSIAKHDE